MKILKSIILPGFLPFLPILFLTSCVATTVPEIYLTKSDITMELKKEAYAITAMAISRDGKYLMTGDNGGSIEGKGTPWLRLWDLVEMKQTLGLKDLSGTVNGVDISHDGKYAIAGGSTHSNRSDTPQYPLSIWDINTGKVFKAFDNTQAGHLVTSASYSGDGKYFLITTLNADTQRTDIRIFDTQNWGLIRSLTPPKEPGYMDYIIATFSPDGKYILSGGPASIARLWDIETGREIRTFEGHKYNYFGGMASVAFSPDGKQALTSGWYDEFVRLWDIETGGEVRSYFSTLNTDPWYKANVLGVTVSPDWKQALIFSREPKLYDIKTGRLVSNIGHLWKGLKTRTGSQYGGWPASGRYHPNGKYIFMTMTDAAVRIYDAATGEEIAVLIGFDDGEWLVITSEGYYNSSERGAQYLGVKVGDNSYGVDSFYDVFYRPDIVAAKLRGDDIKDLITITMQDAIKTPPPSIEFTTSETDKPKAKICYQAKSTGGGIGEVRLFHNGKLVESDGYYREVAKTEKNTVTALNSKAIYDDMRSVSIKGSIEKTTVTNKMKGEIFEDCKEIETISGENEISITAFNKDNTIQGAMKTIKFNSKTQLEEPNLYILAIGINEYKDKTITLKYAAKDAKDMQEKLLQQAKTIYKPQNIKYELIKDDTANKTNITNKINELSKIIKPNDSFILFIAGHGVLLQNQYYILTNDYDGTIDTNNMISSNEIVEMSKKIKSLSQLFIFDTCHAGGVDTIISGLYDARMSVLAKKMGLHIYASANSLQQALDGYQNNGLFTFTLLDGLNNKKEADQNKDNSISFIELGEYTKQMTTDLSQKSGHAQTPFIINFGKDNTVYKLY